MDEMSTDFLDISKDISTLSQYTNNAHNNTANPKQNTKRLSPKKQMSP